MYHDSGSELPLIVRSGLASRSVHGAIVELQCKGHSRPLQHSAAYLSCGATAIATIYRSSKRDRFSAPAVLSVTCPTLSFLFCAVFTMMNSIPVVCHCGHFSDLDRTTNLADGRILSQFWRYGGRVDDRVYLGSDPARHRAQCGCWCREKQSQWRLCKPQGLSGLQNSAIRQLCCTVQVGKVTVVTHHWYRIHHCKHLLKIKKESVGQVADNTRGALKRSRLLDL